MSTRRPVLLGLALIGVSCVALVLVLVPGLRPAGRAPQNAGAGGEAPSQTPIVSPDLAKPVSDRVAAQMDPHLLLQEKITFNLQSIGAESHPGKQSAALEALANQVEISQFPAALNFLQERATNHLVAEFQNLLIRRWAGSNAPVAAEWVQKNLTGSTRQTALNSVAAQWTATDPQAAEEWARQLPEAGERTAALLTIATELNRNDPSVALALAVDLPFSEARDEFIAQSAGGWAAGDFAKAAAWAAEIKDETLRHRVLGAMAVASAEKDPAAAATLAAQSLPAGRVQDDAVVSIVQHWVQKEPQQAAAWVTAFPPGHLRDTALEAVVKLWADQDLAEAGVWINSLTARTGRDAAVAAYVEKVAVQYPEMAAEWAQEIGDEKIRGERMENLAELWLQSDAPAARKWIAQAPLSDAAKSRLLALPKQ